MLLFRYLRSHGFETLDAGLLKAAAPSTFNDPFESLPSLPKTLALSDAKKLLKGKENSDLWYSHFRTINPSVRNKREFKSWARRNLEPNARLLCEKYPSLVTQLFERIPKMLDENQRVVCFSEPCEHGWKELLLWAHYALDHKGLRIGFRFPSQLPPPLSLLKIKYSEVRLELPFRAVYEPRTDPLWFLRAMELKSTAWAYEHEVRLIAPPTACKQDPSLSGSPASYIPFDPSAVAFIDVGMRFPREEEQRIRKLAASKYPRAQVRKAHLHPQEFRMEYH